MCFQLLEGIKKIKSCLLWTPLSSEQLMEDQILDTILFDLCCNFTLKVLDFVYEYDLRQEVNAGDGRLCLIAEIDIFF